MRSLRNQSIHQCLFDHFRGPTAEFAQTDRRLSIKFVSCFFTSVAQVRGSRIQRTFDFSIAEATNIQCLLLFLRMQTEHVFRHWSVNSHKGNVWSIDRRWSINVCGPTAMFAQSDRRLSIKVCFMFFWKARLKCKVRLFKAPPATRSLIYP